MNKFISYAIHALILIVATAVTFLMVPEVTTSVWISYGFSVFSYLCFAGSGILAANQSRDKTIQNLGISTVTLVYCIVTVIASIILAIVAPAVKIHAVIEIIIMAIGLIMTLLMVAAKNHIEGQ